MEAAENISWDLALRQKIFGLENRRKSSQIYNDEKLLSVLPYLQFILLLKISIYYLFSCEIDNIRLMAQNIW